MDFCWSWQFQFFLNNSMFASLLLSALVLGQTPLPNPPTLPQNYPGIDQTVMISGSFLLEPAIVEAIDFVKASVPADILAIEPSVYLPETPNRPAYPEGQAAVHCYWPYFLRILFLGWDDVYERWIRQTSKLISLSAPLLTIGDWRISFSNAFLATTMDRLLMLLLALLSL
jgi:hypothetical protein